MTIVTPPNITELAEREVFVFGSNQEGAHAGGAAKYAYDHFGALWGQAEGLQGQAYAIDTMSGMLELAEGARRFVEFARQHPELRFLVTEIGCGIAGYAPENVAWMLADAPGNVVLPQSFHDALHPQTSLPGFQGPDLMGTVGDILGLPRRLPEARA